MHQYLTSKGLKQVDEEEALALQLKGAVIVDVRLAEDFKKEHIEGGELTSFSACSGGRNGLYL